MNKKQIAQIIVIIASFAGAGLVLYNGFFKNSGTPAVEQTMNSQGSQNAQVEVLPFGNALDFSVLDTQSLQYNQVEYPKLDPQTDYGIPVENLIVSPVVTTK